MNVNMSPAVTAVAEKRVFYDGHVALNASTREASPTYQWIPSMGLSNETIPNPVAKPSKTTVYSIMVTGANGCAGTAKIKVTVLKNISIPNAFTPNGDGKNDVFKIPVDNSVSLKSFTVENSKGKVIYETDDITKPWDGTVKGIPVESGTYSYTVTGTSANGKVSIKDNVEVYR